jgi:hypothetical protein
MESTIGRFEAAGIELEPAAFVPGSIKLEPSLYVLEKSLRIVSFRTVKRLFMPQESIIS